MSIAFFGGWMTEKQIFCFTRASEQICVSSAECSLLLSLDGSAVTEGLLCGYTIVEKHLEHSLEYGHLGGMSRGYFKVHTVCLNKIAWLNDCYVKDEHKFLPISQISPST